MMERFIERASVSKYKDNFIIKGGILVTSLVGISLRSTLDIDSTIKNQSISENDAKRMKMIYAKSILVMECLLKLKILLQLWMKWNTQVFVSL